MSNSMWIQFPESYEMCNRCVGTGQQRCASCGGSGGGYETEYEYDYDRGYSVPRQRYQSCASCAGSGGRMCASCGGSGSTRRLRPGRSSHESSADGVRDDQEDFDRELAPAVSGKPAATAADRFSDLNITLEVEIEYASALPQEVRTYWLRRLKSIEFEKPTTGVKIVRSMLSEVEQVRTRLKPERSVWDLEVASSMEFERQLAEIERNLRSLQTTLDVQAIMNGNVPQPRLAGLVSVFNSRGR